MKNKLLILVGVIAAVATTSVTALPTIEGSIGFGGAFTTTGGSSSDLTTVDKINITSAIVLNSGGDLTFPIGTSVTMFSPIDVNPVVLPGSAIWSVGGFSMVLNSLFQSPAATTTTLSLQGMGTISAAGFEDTVGTFTATFNSQGGSSLTWSSSSSAVPDGGMTVMLLGAGLSGLALIRRKLA